MTRDAERLTQEALARGEDPLCFWCHNPYSQHEDHRDPNSPVPKVPCVHLKAYFDPADYAQDYAQRGSVLSEADEKDLRDKLNTIAGYLGEIERLTGFTPREMECLKNHLSGETLFAVRISATSRRWVGSSLGVARALNGE